MKPALLFLTESGAWLLLSGMYFGGIEPQYFIGKTVSHGVFARPD